MISKRIVLHFPHKLVDQPTVYGLAKDYNLLILELSGEKYVVLFW